MEILILDETFKSLYLIDSFESLIWTERYNGAGNFEIYTPINDYILEICKVILKKLVSKLDTYVWLKGVDDVMYIETIEMSTDVETGANVIISGKSLEYILHRRIIWNQTTIDGNLQNGIKKLINENVISPSIADRKIPPFIFKDSTDKNVTSLTLRAQYTGDNLYDTILTICATYNLGFKVTLSSSNQFVFELYAGTDRSYDQNENPYVIFSPKFENILNSNYLESISTLMNVTLVAGEDEGTSRKTRTVGSGSGLARRELYTDARDLQSEMYVDGENVQLTDTEYNEMLDQRGKEKLAQNVYTKTFEGEVEPTRMFVYGEDFYKGDIVQIETEFGITEKVRVSEVVRSQDAKGYSMYPTFEIVT